MAAMVVRIFCGINSRDRKKSAFFEVKGFFQWGPIITWIGNRGNKTSKKLKMMLWSVEYIQKVSVLIISLSMSK